MGLRTENRPVFANRNFHVLKRFSSKKKFIAQYVTEPLFGPTQNQIDAVLAYVYHAWGDGDSLQELANQYYSDPTLWWLIAAINKKPTEHELKHGDILFIPTDVGEALALVRVG